MSKSLSALEKYVELKREINRLQEEIDQLKDEVFTTVDGQGGKLENDQYVINSQKRPKYKFSENYDKKSEELKALKKEELENGTAVIDGYSEFVTIKFRDPDS